MFNLAVTFSSVWDSFSSAFGTVFDWIAGNSILLLFIAFPLGAFLIGTIIKVFK